MLVLRTSSLLNVNSLVGDLELRRETTYKYIGLLEHLFLLRRLPAWHNNRSKPKTPKVHWVDSGLAAMLNNLSPKDWASFSTDFGPLLESFVVQQITAQAAWLEEPLQLSHYRDRDQVEMDLVIERGRSVWGIAVKKAASTQAKDGEGLQRLASQAGSNFKGGALIYCGNNCLPLKTPNCYAVPINGLWQEV